MMTRLRRIGRIARKGATVGGLILIILVVFFTQTPLGMELVLREVLRRVQGAIAGEIRVEGISSPGLLRGFTFRGVRILGEDGRSFLEADSIMAGLSSGALLKGDLILTRVSVWSPRIRLERLPGQDRLNVVSIFASGGEEGDEAIPVEPAPTGELPDTAVSWDSVTGAAGGSPGEAAGRTISFHRFRIFDGTLDILLPAPAGGLSPERALVEPSPDGTSLMRRLSFREIQLNLSEGLVRAPGQEGERFAVERLSFLGEIRPAPFRVEELKGELRREKGRLLSTVEQVRLPSSQAHGTVVVSWGVDEGVTVAVEGESDGLALEDLHWIEPRLPRGVATGPFGLEMGNRGLLLRFPGTRLALSQGNLRARGGLLLGSPIRLDDLNLTLDGVDLGILDPWLPDSLPFHGQVTGDLSLSGGPSSLAVSAAISLSGPDSTLTTAAEVTGVFHFGDALGVTGLVVTLAPLDWGTFADLSPAMRLRGPGALRLEANGSLPLGITVDAEATHVPAGMVPSRVTARGTVQSIQDDILLSLNGELSPLSFTSLRRYFEDLPLTGEVSGPVALRGSLSDLTVEAQLLTPAGPIGMVANFDARDPSDHYSVDSEFQEFLLSSLLPSLPEPTLLTGRILASGRGMTFDALEGDATLYLRRGEVGALRVDTAALVARVEDGRLALDALIAETNLGRLTAGGAFGISSSSEPGDLTVEVESESLEGLRPFLMGDVPLVRDSLTQFERGLLALEGVALDTIPTAEEVAVDGRLQGRAVFTGGLTGFSGEGVVSVQDLRYRTDYLQRGTLTFSARDLPGDGWRIQGLLSVDSVRVFDLSFRGGEVEGEVGKADGRARVVAARGEGEEYQAKGTFALDSVGGRVDLDELNIRVDTVRWNLGGPTSVVWSPEGVQVRDFRLIRPGLGRMRIQADGFLPFRGAGDFNLEIQQFHLDRLARLAQLDVPLQGTVDFRVRVGGTAENPTMQGRLSGESLRYEDFTLSGLESEFTYEGERLQGEAWASEGGRQVLVAEGSFPADLRIRPAGPRIPRDGAIDLTIAVDSFPAALALVVVEGLEEVQGALSGQVRLGGTPSELAPEGALHLGGGSVFVTALGIRFTDVEAAFALNRDGTVEVDGGLRSGGTGRVTGTVNLHPLTDPRLDLTVRATNFLAAARRDVQAQVSGEVQVLQTYRRPRVQGSLTVEQGVLQVEELARTAEVVDLSDPIFMDVLEEETTLRPIVQENQNPFLQNLMLAIDLSMARDSWLRGRDLNVEMDGELQVFWDRTQRDLAMVGELEAVRGYYTVLGRQFQVRSGGVSFLGTPGVNPNLNIEAIHRLRTPEEQLEIIANVGGTLLTPRVSLTSNKAYGIAESDLVSYLIFGRPAYALASGQNQYVQGAAGSLLGAAGGATLNLGLGTVGSQLGSVVARDFGLDFLAISQGDYVDPFAKANLWGTVATTQVEIGQYLTQNVFAVLMWRPLSDLGAAGGSQFAGLRLEWRLADFWTLEGFVEDRFARSPFFQAGNLINRKVLGFFFWREWGY